MPPQQMARPTRTGEAPSWEATGASTAEAVTMETVMEPRPMRRHWLMRKPSRMTGMLQLCMTSTMAVLMPLAPMTAPNAPPAPMMARMEPTDSAPRETTVSKGSGRCSRREKYATNTVISSTMLVLPKKETTRLADEAGSRKAFRMLAKKISMMGRKMMAMPSAPLGWSDLARACSTRAASGSSSVRKMGDFLPRNLPYSTPPMSEAGRAMSTP